MTLELSSSSLGRSLSRQSSEGLEADPPCRDHCRPSRRGTDDGIEPITHTRSFRDFEGFSSADSGTSTTRQGDNSTSLERSVQLQSYEENSSNTQKDVYDQTTSSDDAMRSVHNKPQNEEHRNHFSRSNSPRPYGLSGQKSSQVKSIGMLQLQAFRTDYSDSFGREIVKSARLESAQSLDVDQIQFQETSMQSSAFSDVTHSTEFSYRGYEHLQSNQNNNPYSQRFEKSLESIQSALMSSQETTANHIKSSSTVYNDNDSAQDEVRQDSQNCGQMATSCRPSQQLRAESSVDRPSSSSDSRTRNYSTPNNPQNSKESKVESTTNYQPNSQQNTESTAQTLSSISSITGDNSGKISQEHTQSEQNSQAPPNSSRLHSNGNIGCHNGVMQEPKEIHPDESNSGLSDAQTEHQPNNEQIPSADSVPSAGHIVQASHDFVDQLDGPDQIQPLKGDDGDWTCSPYLQRSRSTGDECHGSFLHPLKEEEDVRPTVYKRSRSSGDEQFNLMAEGTDPSDTGLSYQQKLERMPRRQMSSSITSQRGGSFLTTKPKRALTLGAARPGAFNESGRAFGERPSWAQGERQSRRISGDSPFASQRGSIGHQGSVTSISGPRGSTASGRGFGTSSRREMDNSNVSQRGSSEALSMLRTSSMDSIDPLDDPLSADEEQQSIRNDGGEASDLNRSHDPLFDPLNEDVSLDEDIVSSSSFVFSAERTLSRSAMSMDFSVETVVTAVSEHMSCERAASSTRFNSSSQELVQQKKICNIPQRSLWLVVACFIVGISAAVFFLSRGFQGGVPVETDDDCQFENPEPSTLEECQCRTIISMIPPDALSAFNTITDMYPALQLSALSPDQPVSCDNIEAIAVLEMAKDQSTSRDRLALLISYIKLGGTGWLDNEGWFSSASVCEWFGVECRDDRVVGLNLTNNLVVGKAPIEITWLTALETLDLSSNRRLEGAVQSGLASLQNLVRLNLGHTAIGGPIPTELGLMSKLVSLNLEHTSINSTLPTEFGSFSQLESLIVQNTQISGTIPGEIGLVPSLTDLQLSNNRFEFSTIPSEIWNLTNLVSLQLSKVFLSGTISHGGLTRLTDLHKLDLRFNVLAGGLPTGIGMLTKLESFYISHNDLGGELPSEIGRCKSLKELDLNQCQLTGSLPEELVQLTLLEALSLSGNPGLVGSMEDFCAAVDESMPVEIRERAHEYIVDGKGGVVCPCCTYRKQENC